MIVLQVAASLPVVLRERLAWVPVTVEPARVSLTPTFQEASAAAACLDPCLLGPLGRLELPLVRATAAAPVLLRSSRIFKASSRLLISGFPWRITAAVPLAWLVLASFPRFARASLRASTRARLGLCWLWRRGVCWLWGRAETAPGLKIVVGAWVGVATGTTTGVAGGVCFATSLRVRSLPDSALLPRRLKASRLARARSRLGLAMRPLFRLWLGATKLCWRNTVGSTVTGAEATTAVRLGRASTALRTLPALVE